MANKKNKRNKNDNNRSKIEKMAGSMRESGRGEIKSDVLGSYTGTGSPGEVPEQDGDDI